MVDGGEMAHVDGPHADPKRLSTDVQPLEQVLSPTSPVLAPTALPSYVKRSGALDIDDYFTGPRDIQRHSKWPMFLQMHGSILPKLILPLLFISAWATAITVLNSHVVDLGVNSVLLTITGFVVGLGLSFRNATAYERYAEGRKYWAALVQASHVLGRVFWIHATDAPAPASADGRAPDGREQTLKRISSMNLVVAFAVALKHSLRFEPYTAYPDLQHLVGHLDTFARAATETRGPGAANSRRRALFRDVGEYLGVSFAASNPRKALKRAAQPLGNLPLEILTHLAVAVDSLVATGQLRVPMQQTLAYNNLSVLNDALTGTERVLSTPLPIAYSIAISQVTWLYVVLLPFQLVEPLGWIAIPATIGASFIILGLLFIGREIENPFGNDVNDLPLDCYCDQIAADMDIIAAHDPRSPEAFFYSPANMPLFPVSAAPMGAWMQRSEDRLREAIRARPAKMFEWRQCGTTKSKCRDGSAATSLHGLDRV